jgi:hypothetical protein
VAAASFGTRIGHAAKGLAEAAELIALERAAGTGDTVLDARGLGGGKLSRAA